MPESFTTTPTPRPEIGSPPFRFRNCAFVRAPSTPVNSVASALEYVSAWLGQIDTTPAVFWSDATCAGVASTPAMGSDWNVMPCVMPRPVSSDR